MNEDKLLTPPVSSQLTCRAGRLYTAGLFLFAFSCNFSISAAQISLGLALIGFIGLYRTGKIQPRPTQIDKPFAFFAFAGILSIFRAEDLSLAITDIKKFLLIFCFYLMYLVKMSEETIRKLFTVFVFSAGLAGIINSLSMPFVTLVGNRPKGFYSSIMTFGECQALGLLGAIALFSLEKKNFARLSLCLLAVISTAYSVMFSMVRSAWAGLILAIPLMLFHFPRRTAFAMTAVLLATSPYLIVNHDIQDRLKSFNPAHTAEIAKVEMTSKFNSSSLQRTYHRLTAWWRGLQMLENNFPFGVGLDNVKPGFAALASEFETKNDMIWGHQHNNFIQFLVTTGFLGLAAFVYLIIATIKFFAEAFKGKKSTFSGSLGLFALPAYICFIGFGIGEFSWADEDVAMMAFFLVGLMMNRYQSTHESAALSPGTSS
jgi:O-antigen ligase